MANLQDFDASDEIVEVRTEMPGWALRDGVFVHKALLCNSSSYFAKQLKERTITTRHHVVQVRSAEHHALPNYVKWLYTSRLALDELFQEDSWDHDSFACLAGLHEFGRLVGDIKFMDTVLDSALQLLDKPDSNMDFEVVMRKEPESPEIMKLLADWLIWHNDEYDLKQVVDNNVVLTMLEQLVNRRAKASSRATLLTAPTCAPDATCTNRKVCRATRRVEHLKWSRALSSRYGVK